MRRLFAVLVALIITLSACGEVAQPPNDGPTFVSGGSESPLVPETMSPTRSDVLYTHVTAQGTCTSEGEGVPLELGTTDASEAVYLSGWDACTSIDSSGASYTWLRNGTDALWIMPGISWEESRAYWASDKAATTERASLFHETAASESMLGDTLYLSPGAAVRIARDPADVQWELNLPLTFAWEGQEALLDKLEEKGQQVVAQAFTRKSSVSRSIAICTLSVYNYASDLAEQEKSDAADVVLTGFTTVSAAGSCYQEARKARATLANGQVVSVYDDVLMPLPTSVTRLNQITENIKPFQGSGKVLLGTISRLLR